MASLREYLARAHERIAKRLPGEMAAKWDELKPSTWSSWWGPFNGQVHRQELVRTLFRTVDFNIVIETGTFRGDTAEFLAHLFGGPIFTVESAPRRYHYARRRLRTYSHVETAFGHSVNELVSLAGRVSTAGATVFAYLDAHWEDELPLVDEIRVIASAWPRSVILVDDFQVGDDEGYGFDDYGPGKTLTWDLIPWDALEGWEPFYPSARSSEETGAKRGTILLAGPELAGLVEGLAQVRRAKAT